jgi:hypothetical protein
MSGDRSRHETSAYGCKSVGQHEGESTVGSSRHRWEDDVKMDMGALGWTR